MILNLHFRSSVVEVVMVDVVVVVVFFDRPVGFTFVVISHVDVVSQNS